MTFFAADWFSPRTTAVTSAPLAIASRAINLPSLPFAQITAIFIVVTMPPAAAQMMMKAVGFLLLVHICFQFVVSLFWRHQYTTEHVVTPGAPEPGKLSVAAILPAQMIGAFKPVYL